MSEKDGNVLIDLSDEQVLEESTVVPVREGNGDDDLAEEGIELRSYIGLPAQSKSLLCLPSSSTFLTRRAKRAVIGV